MTEETEALCRSVTESCKDPDTKYDAVNTLIALYKATGETEKACRTAQTLTPMKYCREFTLSNGIGDGKTVWYIQNEIAQLTDCLASAIVKLVSNDELPNDESTWDQKLEMIKTANELCRLIDGDDRMLCHERLSGNYLLLAIYRIAQGKTDETLDALEKMGEHTLRYDCPCEEDCGKRYSSIFTDRLVNPENGDELTEHNQSYYKLDRLRESRDDGIRNDPRFAALVKALEEKAR